ncbi:hypothetical protein F4604DRAFT_1679645 [Suillus subluteus]|nr:hypothetical protein F4604DRAFT_1679645 [Suillus subluteus]
MSSKADYVSGYRWQFFEPTESHPVCMWMNIGDGSISRVSPSVDSISALLLQETPRQKRVTAPGSLKLVCDSVSVLSPEDLRLCIKPLGQFGRQADTNIALTAAESLLWTVSDSIQAKWKDAEMEPEYSTLWMCQLLEVLGLCTDDHIPATRRGIIETSWRSAFELGTLLNSGLAAQSPDGMGRIKESRVPGRQDHASGLESIFDPDEWPLQRLNRLMEILKGVLTYPNSTDYCPDVDGLSPIQAVVLDAIADINLTGSAIPLHLQNAW